MTGRIYKLDHANTAGSIKGENGQIIPFDFSVVLAYDVACLGVGQIVTFELRSEGRHHAVDVSVRKLNVRSDTKEKLEEQLRLRYLGFDQQGGVRSYRFERAFPESRVAAMTRRTGNLAQGACRSLRPSVPCRWRRHRGIRQKTRRCLSGRSPR